MDVAIGLRVVRGPDWERGEEDGGEGHVGTVVGVGGGRSVEVQWDCGERGSYRCGEGGKYDLRVFDSGPAGIKHTQTTCEWCFKEEKLSGTIWRCVQCFDYYLCNQCYMAGKHSKWHEFQRIDGTDHSKRTRVSCRLNARMVEAKGIFPGAKVVRGHDWRWKNQDGGPGTVGKVLSIRGWQRENTRFLDTSSGSGPQNNALKLLSLILYTRSVIEVEWTSICKKNIYRVGHKGKVDLKCIESGRGGHYYPEHLFIPGAPYEPPKPREFATGDVVKVELGMEVLKLMQQGHGGWIDQMAGIFGKIGVVYVVLETGDLRVRYPNNTLFILNPEVVTKVDIPYFTPGDIVRVLDDIAKVHELQQETVGWVDEMALTLGQVGEVKKWLPSDDVLVRVNKSRWIYNSRCLVPAPEADLPNNDDDDDDVDLNARSQLYIILSEGNSLEGIAYAAAAGDLATLKQHLEQYPQEINRTVKGKTPVHIACMEGYISVLKVLLEHQPDLEFLDETGERPLHICVYANRPAEAKLLLDAGANVNSTNVTDSTALMIAAGVGHCSVISVLIDHPDIDLNAKDALGGTALHHAVSGRKNKAVRLLLDAGADPTVINYKSANPFQEATLLGLLPAVEYFVTRCPQHINIPGENDYTPLHIAAANNYADIADLLASQSSCGLNLLSRMERITPLHIAVHEGHPAVIEVLVGYGADLNAETGEGHTILHMAIVRKNMKAPDARAPRLLKIQTDLEAAHRGMNIEPYITAVCFLAQEGADLHIKNRLGDSPLHLCHPDVRPIFTSFVATYGRGTFHGSLPRIPSSLPKKVHAREVQPQQSAAVTRATQPAAVLSPAALEQSRNINRDVKKDIGKDAMEQREADHHKPTKKTNNEGDQETCCICEEMADAKLAPCGHTVMCLQCAQRAKRCPKCRDPVQSVIPI